MATSPDRARRLPALPAGEVRRPIVRAGVEATAEGAGALLDLWPLGRGAALLRCRGTGLRLTRAAPSGTPQDRVALAVQVLATGRCEQAGRLLVVPPGDLAVVDLASPFTLSWDGDGRSVAFLADLAQLGLPVDAVRCAAARLHTADAALRSLLRDHLQRVDGDGEALAASPAAARAVGAATGELVRALLVSAGERVATARGPVPADPLAARVVAWVEEHLTDPDLTPARIAAAHGVSVRQLYKLWPEPGAGVRGWIVRERLEGARRTLADPSCRLGVAAVARRWGFADPTHFSRRFRAAYGLSPRAWREARRPLPGAVVPRQRRAP